MLDKHLAQVTIAGEHVPFHHPDKDPYTCLGVDIIPTLNWSFQLHKIIAVKKNGKLHAFIPTEALFCQDRYLTCSHICSPTSLSHPSRSCKAGQAVL